MVKKLTPDDKNKILQNLKDADCNSDLISKFFQLADAGKILEQVKLLTLHRKALLNKLHKSQKQIDCLDYLIFSIEHGT